VNEISRRAKQRNAYQSNLDDSRSGIDRSGSLPARFRRARSHLPVRKIQSRRTRFGICLLIFLAAFGVRLLSWHDTRLEVGKVQSAVVADYHRVAELLRAGGVSSFLNSSSPLADLNNLGHPPGYSFLIASVYSLRHSDTAVQFVQITADSLSAVLIFLLVAELFPLTAGVVAGLLAAFSPQFAWNSVLLLPDSISVLPMLLAIYLLARGLQKPRVINFLIVGALIGLSCWLRANAMLLTLFVAAAVPLLIRFGVPPSGGRPRKRGTPNRPQDAGVPWRFALAVVFGTLLIVLPLTIRNAIVFHRFIPVSLGAGQTLLEGIADYDAEGKLGIPRTDVGIMKQESEIYQRPDYYGTLFNPDGVERERARLSRGFAIIRAHPLWFAGVMTKRASSMLRLERSRLISTAPAITHPFGSFDQMQPDSYKTPQRMLAEGAAATQQAQAALIADGSWLEVTGDESNYGAQFSAPIEALKQNTDYVLTVPVKMTTGRMRVSATSPNGKVYSSAIVETVESIAPEDQPVQRIDLTFVARQRDQLKIVLNNEASNPAHPVARLGPVGLYALGPARFLWTSYPRFIIHAIQKIYLTVVILPLAIIGLLLVVFRKQSAALVILSIVPVYFFCVQSAVHTEYRYVLAVDYFLFAFAGIAVSCAGSFVIKKIIPSPSGRGLG